jgi:putative transposase
VLTRKPNDATHWTVRSVANATGISTSTVQRYFALFGVHPHRAQTFKISPDRCFIEKVRHVVGLSLNPPVYALVLCVDEKRQIRELERTQPNLPMGLVYAEGDTQNDARHRTMTLFAALGVAPQRTENTGSPSTSMRGVMPSPGPVDAAIRPLRRSGAPVAVLTVT